MINGLKTTASATIHEAYGGTETWTGVAVRHGQKTVTNKMIVEPDGAREHQKTVSIRQGDLDSTSQTTTTSPLEVVYSSSATNVIRVAPPSS